MHVADAKRGKTRTGKSRLVLVLLLIARESYTKIFSQLQTIAMKNQSNCEIAFDTQLRNTLIYIKNYNKPLVVCQQQHQQRDTGKF